MMRVLPLTGSHDRQGFDCGRQELNDWLRQVARQHQDKGLSKTFVAVRDDAPVPIRGYYALTLAELEKPPPAGCLAQETVASHSGCAVGTSGRR